MLNETLKNITSNKLGLEVGGPSGTGGALYANAESIDNVIFSSNTVWSNHTEHYHYWGGKK